MLEYAIHTNNWASTEASNYIYYVPSEEKKYGTAATDCTEKILNSLNVIFAGDVPRSILANQAWSVKGAVVSQILAGYPVSPIILDAYRRTFSYNRSLKQRTLNFLILNSASLGPIPRTILRLINR